VRATLQGDVPRYEGGLREVGPGTWAWLAPNGSWGEANAGLVVGDGASALIDTLWDRRLAREMLAAMAPRVAAAPIGLVVNTHSDGDHWWGNAEVPPEAAIVTSRASLDAMRADAPPAALARMRRLARAVAPLPGRAGAMGRYVSAMLAPFDFGDAELRLPDRAFAGSSTEDAGGRELRLIEVGPAHTPGDPVVHVPDAGVVFAADVLFLGVTPVMWAGPLGNWLAALDMLLALDVEAYVPGHGPVGGRPEVEALRDYWRWLGDAVAAQHARGRSPFDAARALARDPEFARFAGWSHPERMAISVTTVHRALSGKGPVPASPIARARMFAQVAQLERELASG
jgi:glyoxylase-like metal-dependent hydrolase (beta-lactamase superfamily II)